MRAMRVIAGAAKGRRLVGPDTRNTRPLTDRVREAVFSSLADKVVGARVLDLFAGSGSIGIEALSRGADHAVFVENGRQALSALRQNLAAVGFDNHLVVAETVEQYLARASSLFDLIFFDPPWTMPQSEVETLLAVAGRLAAPRAQLVLHRRQADPEPDPGPEWRHVTTRRYGDGKIYRYEKEAS
ncbi:MAG TPA: 16S rRNA (guanine(966)-N(2))-methyltransferase RsmD [Acidimicrobiia bacterium]|nr:16S rRNA (guanine(966)-N(2))-methyltransferase RsmD [Acidimicrobiia bacterium]